LLLLLLRLWHLWSREQHLPTTQRNHHRGLSHHWLHSTRDKLQLHHTWQRHQPLLHASSQTPRLLLLLLLHWLHTKGPRHACMLLPSHHLLH
jgi:hypothetical protein